ncbi:MAG: hypothetical protein IID33_09830, partial [Planctomycetes bacterium]|nr:hypothetical protein [Planctomycetota bacterium]
MFTRLLPTGGAAACLLIGCAAMLAVGGCPPTGDGGGGVKDDPIIRPTPTEFNVEITSTQGILQFNSLGLNVLFQRSSTLGTTVTGPGLPDAGFTVVWDIQAPSGGASVLAFGVGAGAPTQTTTGASAEVTVVSDPGDNDVDQVVSATVTLLDSGTVLPTETLTIKIVPDTGADTTVLESNPFATPSVGLDGNSQVVLDAGVTGNSGAFAVNWESISTLPAGIVLPDPATGDTLTLDVTPPVGGVFSFRCTVTDSSENVAVGVVNVFLGQAALMLDVAVTRLHVSPAASAINIRTTRVGGSDDQADSTNGPFSYGFQILDDDDQDVTSSATITPDPTASDNDAVNDWTISGLTTPGQYRISVTVTDAAELLTGSGSVTVALGDGLSLALEPQFDRVGAGTGFSIRTVRGGGESSFTYSFEPVDSAGAAATTTFTPPSGSVDNDAVNNWALTGFATADTYRIFATVRDATGNSVTASTEVVVGDVFTLNVRSSDIVLAPGDTATLTFDGTGGTGAFSYAFAEASPGADSGSFGSASPLSVAGDGTVTWTAPSAPGAGAVEGVYVIDVIATDARGLSAADSIAILVQEDEPLSLDVRSTANIVVPGGSVTLTFDQTGGESTYSYAFSTSGPNAGSSFGNASPKAAVADTTTTWTAPAASGTTEGTYRVDVEVTDALGNTARDSVVLIVQAAAALSLDVTSNIYTVVPGGAINLNFNRTGGVANFTYTYDAIDPAGAGGAGTFGTGSPQTVANDLAETWTAPAPGAGVEGTYRFDVQVRDALQNTFQDSIFVLVQAAAPLSLDVTSNIYTVVPGGAINLNFNRTGGVANFTYTYDAIDPAGGGGAGTFGTGSPQTVADDLAETWTAPAPGAGVEGTYRFDVQVRDALLNTFQDSIFVLVQAAAPLSLDVTSNIYTVVPG